MSRGERGEGATRSIRLQRHPAVEYRQKDYLEPVPPRFARYMLCRKISILGKSEL